MYAVKGNNNGTFEDARQLEQEGALKDAAAVYEKLHKRSPGNIKIIQRLMIIFRKLKNAGKELRYINAAIKINEAYYASKNKLNNKAGSISRQLNKLLGYTKGNAAFKSDEVLKLHMRRSKLLDKKRTATK
jgi:hypothetical protein